MCLTNEPFRKDGRSCMKNFVITVARGFGSGGRDIAAMLADELGVHSYDKRILTLASQYSGYPEHFFREADETLNGSLITKQLQALPKHHAPTGELSKFTSDDRLFDYQKIIIEKLAASESCVIVGKCADYILKDYDNVVSIYVEAPRSYTLRRVMERMDDITVEEAHHLITKTDKYRADYYKYYTGGNYWTNPVNYDLTFNNARLGDERCVKLTLDCMKLKFGDDFVEYLKKNYEPLDVVFRLAQETSLVLLNGGGFDAPEWSIRASLANLKREDYVRIGEGIASILHSYAQRWKESLDK